jgi:hypothetical protein
MKRKRKMKRTEPNILKIETVEGLSLCLLSNSRVSVFHARAARFIPGMNSDILLPKCEQFLDANLLQVLRYKKKTRGNPEF